MMIREGVTMLLLNSIFFVLTIYCLVGASYYFVSAMVFLFTDHDREGKAQRHKARRQHKFLILIPAHNEERVLPRLLDSIKKIEYPDHLFSTCVICDNCDDATEKIAKEKGAMVVNRSNPEERGKGYAIAWALSKLNIESFDAVLMTDADTMLDKDILRNLNRKLADKGVQAVQCYNGVINPDDTPFTRLISLARALEIIYMASRSSLGLTVHLIGNGMCFRSSLLAQHPWTAFSISEDLEYFCRLALTGIRVHFSYASRVLLQEEEKLSDAKTQRQRWSSGRLPLMARYVPGIIWKGLKARKIKRAEAAMILLVPNPSLLGNILLLTLCTSLFFNLWRFMYVLNFISLFFLFLLFLSSFLIVKIDRKKLFSILLVPIYLAWKGLIDVHALLGRKKLQWIKTERH